MIAIPPPKTAETPTEYRAFSDAVLEVGSSGAVADGPANAIELSIASGQGAATASDGLGGMIGGAVWSLGAVSTGNINCLLTWVEKVNKTNVCVCVWRAASAPTSLADIKAASTRWVQVLTQGASALTSTYVKSGTNNLATGNRENAAGSVSIAFTVGADSDGYGGSLSRHAASVPSSQTSGTVQAAASGDFYVALLFSKTATAASAEVIKVKLEAEFLQ